MLVFSEEQLTAALNECCDMRVPALNAHALAVFLDTFLAEYLSTNPPSGDMMTPLSCLIQQLKDRPSSPLLQWDFY